MVLVVEDNDVCARALVRRLDGSYVVARSAAEARLLFESRPTWRAVIVDPGLPEGKRAGIDFLAFVRSRLPDVPAVIVSMQDDADFVEDAKRLRAELVPKAPSAARLLDAFRKPEEREQARRAAILARVKYEAALTDTETEIVGWFLDGKGEAQWNAARGTSRGTFAKHKEAILAKTGDATLQSLVLRLLRRGWDF